MTRKEDERTESPAAPPDVSQTSNLEYRQAMIEARTAHLERLVARMNRFIEVDGGFYRQTPTMTAHIRTPFPSGQSSSLQRSEVPRLNETPREASSAFSVPFDWGLPSPSNRPNLEAVPNEEEREDRAVPAVVRNSMRSLRETVAALEGQTERGANSLAFSQRKNECSCCFEKISAPCYISLCEHTFCTDCLRQLFLRAARNESQFPPRCCGTEFRQETVRKVLTGSEFQEYDIRTEEFNASPRIYCADPKCSQFIRPASIMNDLGTCSSCQKQTHVPCRALAHPGRDCPVDNAQQSVIDLAEQNEWRRCYHCQTVVELRYGCNEVLCRYVSLSPSTQSQMYRHDARCTVPSSPSSPSWSLI